MIKQLYTYYKDIFAGYFNLNLTLLVVFICTTILQYSKLFNSEYIWISIEGMVLQISNDILIVGCIYLLFFIPFLFLKKMHQKSYYFFVILFALIALLNYALTNYYIENQLPLGSNYKDYFWDKNIVKSRYTIGTLLIYLIGFIILLRVLQSYNQVIKKVKTLFFLFLACFISSIFLSFYTPVDSKNKTGYLVSSLISNKIEKSMVKFSSKSITGFPFLKEHQPEDVLGHFFDTISVRKPNLVLIIVDGVEGKFLQKKSEYRSFMPFLDSLAQQSLQWTNFLSVSEKPYQSLPAVLGSLPYGEQGFTLLDPYPRYLSLPAILKENGYQTSFYAGFDSKINRLDNFLLNSGVTYIKDKNTFPKGLKDERNPYFSDGYQDSLLFTHGLRNHKIDTVPKLDIYFTLSSKKPYYHPNTKEYQDQFQEVISKNEFSNEIRQEIAGNPSLFSNLMYLDHSLQYFIKEFKKKPDYAHTLFLITGSMGSLTLETRNNLARYEVPLLIFSEFLKTSKEIKSISSHLNITPTLLSYLHESHNIAIPKNVGWMGYEMDTLSRFRNIQQIPFFRSQTEYLDYVWGDYFYSEEKLYKIEKDLLIKEYKNDSIHKELLKKIRTFKAQNYYSTTKNKIVPDSLISYSYNYEKLSSTEQNWIKEQLRGKGLEESYLMAATYARNQEIKKSQLICKYLLNLSPEYYDVRILLGRTYAWNNQFTKAIEHFNRVLQSNPEYLDAYRALMDAYWWSNQNEKVIQLENELENLNINDVSLQLKIVRSYKELDSIAKAREINNTILKNNPNQKEALKFKNELEN